MRPAGLILALLIATAANAGDFRAYVYWIPMGSVREISWSAMAPPVSGYEFYFEMLEDGKRYGRGVTTGHDAVKLNVRFRNHGHFVLWVRSFDNSNNDLKWSAWVNSLDPQFGMVNGIPCPWVAYVTERQDR